MLNLIKTAYPPLRSNKWIINKATDTNGIATEGEAKSKLGYSGSVDTNKCCTKSRAITFGADSSKLGSYSDNQLVKYSDLQKKSSTLIIWCDSSLYYAEASGTVIFDGSSHSFKTTTTDKYTASVNDESTVREPIVRTASYRSSALGVLKDGSGKVTGSKLNYTITVTDDGIM